MIRPARVLTLLLTVCYACGGSDDDPMARAPDGGLSGTTDAGANAPSSAEQSGVDRTKPLLSLSLSEGKRVCEYYVRRRAASIGSAERYCNAWAAYVAETTAECQVEKEDCLTYGYGYALEPEFPPDCAADGVQALFAIDIGGGCTATVGEFEACIETDWQAHERYANVASCSDASTFGSYSFRNATAECKLMYGKCARLEGAFASLL